MDSWGITVLGAARLSIGGARLRRERGMAPDAPRNPYPIERPTQAPLQSEACRRRARSPEEWGGAAQAPSDLLILSQMDDGGGAEPTMLRARGSCPSFVNGR